MLMVLGEPLEVEVERIQTGRREDADLTHAAAHPLAPDAGLVDGSLRADHQRADQARRAPCTGTRRARRRSGRSRQEACPSPHGRSRPGPRRDGSRRPSVVGESPQRPQVLDRLHRPAGEVVGVLHRQRRGRHEERPQVRREHPADHRQVDWPRVVGPGAHREAGVRRVRTELGAGDVGLSRTTPPPRARPGCARASTLAIDPVGVNRAASWPNSPATRSSSARTVGSSPYTSSPTSARTIASRIAAVGRVRVSGEGRSRCQT